MKIAVMQPYFWPYSGFFRLFTTDLFVILDCVQFNRRGRVHRYEKANGWVTLPLKKTDRDTTRIMDIEWRDKMEDDVTPVEFIAQTMRDACEKLELPFNTVRSSQIAIDHTLRGQDKIIAICEHIGANQYINSPGGRQLYDAETFRKRGIKLNFLPDYKGNYHSVAERFANEDHKTIRQEIMDNI